jgi:hypothetical protein
VVDVNTFHRNLSRFNELKTSKTKNGVDLARDLAWEGVWSGNYVRRGASTTGIIRGPNSDLRAKRSTSATYVTTITALLNQPRLFN